jgi:hypothetical protein
VLASSYYAYGPGRVLLPLISNPSSTIFGSGPVQHYTYLHLQMTPANPSPRGALELMMPTAHSRYLALVV